MGKANDRVLVVLLSDRREVLPTGPERGPATEKLDSPSPPWLTTRKLSEPASWSLGTSCGSMESSSTRSRFPML
ncbi:hypothetical protein HanXRQr2_Chr12g0535881 [Helianthus annuus]|uniref:Uncharacterized protein n=1 Tax=Helianthus annuus TaxID=4232 RepID=A0A9K3HFP6_HELAN|nr:hypothetical protein HanXRQr2_Chr12g0535881 [Helianthus annuus]KAJ0862270.1 hypothetical protein HanPSC8_Chr12g0516171 [Helianthus annuus]